MLGKNPETGPFFVETAWPGDTLVVHFTRIRLNRDYAVSDDAIIGRALDDEMAIKMKDDGKTVRWHLDRNLMLATSERPGDHLNSRCRCVSCWDALRLPPVSRRLGPPPEIPAVGVATSTSTRAWRVSPSIYR